MPRRFCISCEPKERDHQAIRDLMAYLHRVGCMVEVAPVSGAFEEAIERCDVFVAALGWGYRSSSWLPHEAFYALTLCRARLRKRPRILGLRLDENEQMPGFIPDAVSGWIAGEETYPELFVDLPWNWEFRPTIGEPEAKRGLGLWEDV